MHCCCLVSHTRFVRRLLSSESSPQRIGGSAPTVADRTAAEEPLLLLDNRLEESDELQSWKAMQNEFGLAGAGQVTEFESELL